MGSSMSYHAGDWRVSEMCSDCGEALNEVYTKRPHYMLDRSGKTHDWIRMEHTTSDCLGNLKKQIEELREAVDALKHKVWGVEDY